MCSLMLTTTHLALAILLGLVLNLNRDEWFIALTFGVAIDADHLFAAPRYVSHNGLGAILRPSWDDGSGIAWRSLLHQPVGAFVVAPLAIGWRFMAPLLFWGIHVGVDYLQEATLSYTTPLEIALFSCTCAGIVFLVYRRWSESRPGTNFKKFLSAMRDAIMLYLSRGERASQGGAGNTG